MNTYDKNDEIIKLQLEEDTGWLPVDIIEGTGSLQYRIKNGVFTLRGHVTGVTGNYFRFCNLPFVIGAGSYNISSCYYEGGGHTGTFSCYGDIGTSVLLIGTHSSTFDTSCQHYIYWEYIL